MTKSFRWTIAHYEEYCDMMMWLVLKLGFFFKMKDKDKIKHIALRISMHSIVHIKDY